MGAAVLNEEAPHKYGVLLWDGWMTVLESLWVRIRREDFKGDAMVGTCYRPPDEGEEMGKTFFKQL